jgi:cytidylate kinase
MFKYLQQHPEVYQQLSPEQKRQWKELLRRYNGVDTIVEKNGGILKAAKGTVLSGSGEDITAESSRYKGSKAKTQEKYDELRKREQKAKERGFDSIYAMDANDEDVFGGDLQMNTSDVLRLTTMAQDVASVVASFVPGAGTGVAAGLGVTSMATDLVADIMDPAVSGGEVAKNLAVNAGFALAGMIPGAKMHKVVKNVIKWAPRVMTIVAGAGYAMDESVQNTFKKIGDGSTNFTREDWKNISRVFSFAAGAVKTGKGMYDSHKVGKAVIAGDNVTLKGVKSSTADADMQLPKKTVDEINAKLSKAETEDQAKEILKELKNESNTPIFANDEQIAAALKTPLLSGKKVKIGKYQLVGTEGTVDEGKTYENLRALWDKDAAALKKQSETSLGKAAIWFGDKFGGGAYGANQRAIMANADNLENTLAYKGWYNPMVDWKGIRQNAGFVDDYPIVKQSTPTQSPTGGNIEDVDVSKAPTINTGLFDQNSAGRGVQKAIQGKTPYNGDDLVADGIHQVKSEPPYNGDDLVADGIHMSKSKQLVPLAEKPISKFRDSDFVKALVDPTQFARV